MRRLRSGRPLWLDRPFRKRKYPIHRGKLEVDVVIVGGGITGAICAYLFAVAGVRVALVESKLVGHGSTVASTALLMQEPDRDFTDLTKRFGRAATREIWKSLARATRDVAKAIRALKLMSACARATRCTSRVDPDKVKHFDKSSTHEKRPGCRADGCRRQRCIK